MVERMALQPPKHVLNDSSIVLGMAKGPDHACDVLDEFCNCIAKSMIHIITEVWSLQSPPIHMCLATVDGRDTGRCRIQSLGVGV